MSTASPAGPAPAAPATASVSTHILDTSRGRPAAGVAVELSARPAADAPWTRVGASRTDADGRCKDLPAPPDGTAHVRLDFAVEPYFAAAPHPAGDPAARPGGAAGAPDPTSDPATHRAEAQQDAPRTEPGPAPGPRDSGVFFPEVAVVFAVAAGEHHHVPLLLNPFGYSVYRGS